MSAAQAEGDPDDRPALSIVIGSRRAEGTAGRCLAALEPQVGPGVEVLLVEDGGPDEAPEWVRRHVEAGALVPQLWAAGIHRARGRIVALTASTLVPDPGWVDEIPRDHGAGIAVVGGPIEPAADLGLVDWAVYLVRYAAHAGVAPGEVADVPGDNASYDGDILRAYGDLYADGFWEPFVHRAMRADGHRLVHSPRRIVRHARGAGIARFSRQRFAHGRHHARRGAATMGRRERIARIVAAPLVPLVMTARMLAQARHRRTDLRRIAAALPLAVWFYTCWAAGEVRGMLRPDGPERGA